ncbi:MAG TPA: signal peptide peptidase SppA [bacterium]|nr:signal peptide peptidase SppA [bacterium]
MSMHSRLVVPILLTTALFVQPLLPAQEEAPATAPTAKEAKEVKEAPPAKVKIAYLRPSGAYADLPEVGFDPLSLLGGGGGKSKPFFTLIERLDELAAAENTEVLLDLSGGFALNLAQQREVERALTRVRGANKRITCYLENAGIGSYQIAAQCDRILLADMGSIDLRSPAMNVMHFKDALDLLGVQVDVTRVGEFKGAVEPFMLPAMSEHLRHHYEAMLESMNADIVRRIASGRKLSAGKVRELQATRLFTAKQAVLEGLVDRLVPWAGAKRALALVRGGEDFELENIEPERRRRRRLDLMSLFSEMLRGSREEEIEDPQVVVMHLSGQIADGTDAVPGNMVSGPTVARLDQLAENDLVKGVVVRINSPGGSATASEAIRLALQRLAKKKPLVFSMGELAASGGYWITAIGEPILAEVGTITGSIGVFGMRFRPGPLFRRIGVHTEIVHIDDGPLIDAIDRPWSRSARARIQASVDEVYERFLSVVAESRDMSIEAVDAIAGGRVWSGQQALDNGLIDRIGGVAEAIEMVRERAGIDGDIEVVHRPGPANFADSLFRSLFEARVERIADRSLLRAVLVQCARFGEVVSLLREALCGDGATRVYALMPAGLRVR